MNTPSVQLPQSSGGLRADWRSARVMRKLRVQVRLGPDISGLRLRKWQRLGTMACISEVQLHNASAGYASAIRDNDLEPQGIVEALRCSALQRARDRVEVRPLGHRCAVGRPQLEDGPTREVH